MDAIDQQIIALMREDARRSFKDIGDRVSLSAPAVKRRVDRLEALGVIKGYTVTVDHSAFGWHAHAFVELFCEGGMSGAEVRDAVADLAEVEGVYTVAGAASAILHLRAEDNQHLEQTLEQIRERDGVLRTQTQIVLSTLLERPVVEGDGPALPSRADADRAGRGLALRARRSAAAPGAGSAASDAAGAPAASDGAGTRAAKEGAG